MDGTCYPAFAGNKARYNGVDGVIVNGHIAANQTWHPNLPYVIDGSLTISNGPALTLLPGTVVKFTPKSKLTINGALVTSAAAEPVVFTSLMDDTWGGDTNNDDGATWPSPGDWETITYADASEDARNVLENAVVRYARADLTINSAAPRILNSWFTHASQYGIDILNNANPWLENNRASDNAIAGIRIAGNSAPVVSGTLLTRNRVAAVELAGDSSPSFANNTLIDNTLNGIYVYGAINGNIIWQKTDPYVVSLLTIPTDGNLTIAAGQVVKLAPQGVIAVNGSLHAQGVPGAPVVFTSLKDDAYGGDTNNDGAVYAAGAGDWRSITIASTGVVSLYHSIVRYGDDLTAKAAIVNSGSLAVAHSEVSHNGTVGIYNMVGAASAFIYHTNLFSHPTHGYAVYNANVEVPVMAQGNWWGASDGPKPYGTGDGINHRLCRDEFGNLFVCQYYVEAAPWLAAPGIVSASPAD
jgi:parallel beta-helix repeat protein